MKSKGKRKVSRMVAFGYLDFTFSVDLSDEDLLQLDIKNLNSVDNIKELENLSKNNYFLDRIILTSNSPMINTMLFVNKTSKFKTFIEYTSFNNFYLNQEEMFFKEVITYVTEHNFLFISESSMCPSPNEIRFVIKKNGLVVREFLLGIKDQQKSEENKVNNEVNNEVKKENSKKGDENSNEVKSSSKVNTEENVKKADDTSLKEGSKKESNKNSDINTMGENNNKNNNAVNNNMASNNTNNKVEEEPRKANEFISKLKCEFNNFNYVYIDLNEIILNPVELNKSNVSLEEILTLLHFVNYNLTQIKIIVNFPNILKNISLISLDGLNYLTPILALTDIYLFERKESIAFFNLIQQLNDPNYDYGKNMKLNDKQLEKLFFSSIMAKRVKGKKIAFFLDDFCRITVIEKSGNAIINNCFPVEMYPKINHTNHKLVEEYKKLIISNKDNFKSYFYGGLLSKFLNGQNMLSGLYVGTEICKRILELYKLNLEFPTDQEFYIVSVKKEFLKNNIYEKQREESFVLDCVNMNKSKLSVYNPLKDNNLYSFFSSNVIRKHLKNVGFINTKGFILDDPSKVTFSPNLKEKSSAEFENEKEKKLLIAIKENEQRSKVNIKKNIVSRSKYLHDSSMKELEKLVRINEYNPNNNPQLPSFNSKFMKLKPVKGYKGVATNKSYEKVRIFL